MTVVSSKEVATGFGQFTNPAAQYELRTIRLHL